jgi:predicted Kef-type K+ transport protein
VCGVLSEDVFAVLFAVMFGVLFAVCLLFCLALTVLVCLVVILWGNSSFEARVQLACRVDVKVARTSSNRSLQRLYRRPVE